MQGDTNVRMTFLWIPVILLIIGSRTGLLAGEDPNNPTPHATSPKIVPGSSDLNIPSGYRDRILQVDGVSSGANPLFRTTAGLPFRTETDSDTNPKYKSRGIAAGLSLALPGAGEYYADKGKESWIRGGVFLALEVAAWTTHFIANGKGKDKEKAYKKFADDIDNTGWSIDRYVEFLQSSPFYESVKNDPTSEFYIGSQFDAPQISVDGKRFVVFLNGQDITQQFFANLHNLESEYGYSHSLPSSKTNDYYEEIFKYPEQYGQGWEGTDPGRAGTGSGALDWTSGYGALDLPPHVATYRGIRNDSNSYYETASTMLGLVVVNHVLSAFDAMLVVRRKNTEIDQKVELGFRLEPRLINQQLIQTASLQVKF